MVVEGLTADQYEQIARCHAAQAELLYRRAAHAADEVDRTGFDTLGPQALFNRAREAAAAIRYYGPRSSQ